MRGWVGGIAGGPGYLRQAASAKLAFEIADGIGKLREQQNFFVRMFFVQKFPEGVEL